MLTIRKEQMLAFEQAAMGRFEEEMAAHCREFSPRLCEVVGDDQVRLAVRDAIGRCRGHGFTSRGPIRLYIEMAFLFGSAFDTDPQYTWASRILHAESEQMVRAERLFARILEYQEKIPDPDPGEMIRTLKGLSGWAANNESSSITEFASSMRREIARISPQKTAYAGEARMTDLVLEGCAAAARHGLSTVHGQALMGMLMFVFGHGFIEDPLHPWAWNLLGNERINDPAGRVVALEKEACAFLERMAAVLQDS